MIFITLFLEFFKIGAFTFGGGYAMIPFIQETVAKHEWISTTELVDFIAVSESTPGAFAVNISTYVGSIIGHEYTGSLFGAAFGAFCATLGTVLPAFLLILIIAKVYDKFKENLLVQDCMFGLRSTVVGLIAATVISIGKEVFFAEALNLSVLSTSAFWFSAVVFVAMLFLLFYKKSSPILIVALSAVLGIGAGYLGLI